ncbi:hypothetical protein LAZ67_20001269 [Cordylochernes scorpioides]|uniref:Integrase catalytic domain-containing protein n=1 Tax=Cordylochernes scorpioides TaxID=51811 RepID=A0ABY6LMC0_9ARAC|nr:hypothetical protein LAZ67_20001269 [Cordylochernes scorpioides]
MWHQKEDRAYHPQTNGLTERSNRTIANMLSMYMDLEQKNWDEMLPFITFAYNTAKQESTGFTPFFLIHGKEAETTLDTIFSYSSSPEGEEFIQNLGTRAEEARQIARHHIFKAQETNKTNYDARHTGKIYVRYFGPFRVTKKILDVTYEVEAVSEQVHFPRPTYKPIPTPLQYGKKTNVATSSEGEAAVVKNPSLTKAPNLEHNFVETIIYGVAFSALVHSGASFSTALEKATFKDEGITLRVDDGKKGTSLDRCTIGLSINGLRQPLEFIVLLCSNPSIIIVWDILEATNAVIDCGRADIRLEEDKDDLNSLATEDRVRKEQGERFHQDIKIIQQRYNDLWNQHMVAEYCWNLMQLSLPYTLLTINQNKGQLWIANSRPTSQIIPKGMSLRRIQVFDENHFTAISECSDPWREILVPRMIIRRTLHFFRNLISDEISEDQQSEVLSILKQFDKVFDTNNEAVRQTPLTKHKIETGDHRPIKDRPYRVSPTE